MSVQALMTKLDFRLCVLFLLVPGCGEESLSTADTGPRDAGGSDPGGAIDSGGVDSGGDLAGGFEGDAAADARVIADAPPPLFESLDDLSVALPHRIGCTPALAFRADGSPLLGITDATSFRVMQIVGRAWSQVGPLVSDTGAVVVGDACPAIVVGTGGAIYAAFQQVRNTVHEARVRRLDGRHGLARHG